MLNKISGTKLTELSDEHLLKLIDKGELNAFDEIVKRYRSKIGNYLFRFTNDNDETEDILQECFIYVYKNKGSYDKIRKFSTWIFTVAGNIAKAKYKSKKEFIIVPIDEMSEDEFESSEFIDDTIQDFDNSDSDEFLQNLSKALEKLEQVFKEVILLRYLEGFEYEKISEILGIPVGTVKSRINRGRERMKVLMK